MNVARTASIAAVAMLLAVGAKASYTPDNNGRVVWKEEKTQIKIQSHTSRRVAKHRKTKSTARHRKTRHAETRRTISNPPPWNMVQVKTAQGFYLTVHPAYAHKFLKFFELLAQNNIKVPKDMVGCYSRRGHVPGSNHYIGAACDIQTGWNRTIPELKHGVANKLIKQAGLYDGCSFGDCGHIESVRGTHNKAPNLYAATEKFKAMQSTANYQP
jgi:hypothetical protein